MRVLVTGSSGHLGEALMRCLPEAGHDGVGLDLVPGAFTQHLADIAQPGPLAELAAGCDAILHTATLHKPHVATHSRQAFIDTNVTGTLNVLEAALAAGIDRVVFTSTTSAFGAALTPPEGAPAAWIDRWQPGVPKNIYGVTKEAAEGLCELYHRRFGLNVLVLRTSRFFPEPDDNPDLRAGYADENAKANEFLYRRVDVADAVTAHLAALDRAPHIGFGRFIISATTPFRPEDAAELRRDAPAVVARCCPEYPQVYAARGYAMFPSLDRVYDNASARAALGWQPVYDFARVLAQIQAGEPIGSPLARRIGRKGYHGTAFADGLYPVEPSARTP